MKYIRFLLLPLLILGMSGCASVTYTWIPPEGKTRADYSSDYADCRLQWHDELDNPDTPYLVPEPGDYPGPLGLMKANADINPIFLKECMEKKGWVRKETQ